MGAFLDSTAAATTAVADGTSEYANLPTAPKPPSPSQGSVGEITNPSSTLVNGMIAANKNSSTTSPKPSPGDPSLPAVMPVDQHKQPQPKVEQSVINDTNKPLAAATIDTPSGTVVRENGDNNPSHPLPTPTQEAPNNSSNEKNINNNSDNNMDIDNDKSNNSGDAIRFRALDERGVLDMYTYHRGREGIELRDEDTGELLCDVPHATDTNRGLDEPKLTTTIEIKFPLEDDHHEDSGTNKQPLRFYKERIPWDFTDPEMPTPAALAADVAENFGLSFKQMLDLADSIQTQLRSFVQQNCSYSAALTAKDSSGNSRDTHQPSVAFDLYGDVTNSSSAVASTGAGSNMTECRGPGFALPGRSRGASSSLSSSTAHGSKSQSAAREKERTTVRPRENRSIYEGEEVEEIYKEEVRKRFRANSTKEINEISCGQLKPIQMNDNYVCHICKDVRANVGVFACGYARHAYCSIHLSSRLELNPSTCSVAEMSLDYCPICSLICTCAACRRKLDRAARDLKARAIEQGATPEATKCDDLVELYKYSKVKCKGQIERAKKKSVPNRRRSSKTQRPTVPKPPAVEFPKEVAGGIDLDPGTELDYLTVFAENGPRVPKDAIGDGPSECGQSKPWIQVEDGNVDYCNICHGQGTMICCSFCPRAFHFDCIRQSEDEEISSESPWECVVCRHEKEELSKYKLDGKVSLTQICAAYDDVNSCVGKVEVERLKLLSILHEMLLALMDYDFGYMFREPVDVKAIEGYQKIVKSPMDLGTIAKKLINGHYRHDESVMGSSPDDMILAILKDIELVWHNCFLFNAEGNAIYRMADVLRQRALRIRNRSFDNLLSERVKQGLDEFVRACELERRTNDQLSRRGRIASKARHKITVAARNKNGRPVCVLDPDTGTAVKIYSTVNAACMAVDMFVGKKFKCEDSGLGVNTHTKVRNNITKSAKDPRLLLYGYRWLYLDELKRGKVIFGAPKTFSESGVLLESPPSFEKADSPKQELQIEVIEMVDGNRSYVFMSIEEALSFPGLIGDTGELRKCIHAISPGQEFVKIEGRKWRRADPNTLTASKSNVEQLALYPATPQSFDNHKEAFAFLDAAFYKEDLIAGRISVRFQSAEAAFQDWVETCEASPLPNNDPMTMDYFGSFFLDGDRNVDGMVWRTKDSGSGRTGAPGATPSTLKDMGIDHGSRAPPLDQLEAKPANLLPQQDRPTVQPAIAMATASQMGAQYMAKPDNKIVDIRDSNRASLVDQLEQSSSHRLLQQSLPQLKDDGNHACKGATDPLQQQAALVADPLAKVDNSSSVSKPGNGVTPRNEQNCEDGKKSVTASTKMLTNPSIPVNGRANLMNADGFTSHLPHKKINGTKLNGEKH